jgi:hypothetical protein
MSANCTNCGRELSSKEVDVNPRHYVKKTENGEAKNTGWFCSGCHQDNIEHKGFIEAR